MLSFPSNPNFTYADLQPAPYDTYPNDVIMVLDSVKTLFSKYFDSVDAQPLSVINNVPHMDIPRIIQEIHTIYLAVDSTDANGNPGCYWSQFIYQFSHELCHFIISKPVVQPMRWFEETLCELSSHFFLLKSAERWSVNPPYPNWRNYSASILSYELEQQNANISLSVSDLLNPSLNLINSLEKDEYQREINLAIAMQLLPYFIDSPELWKIVYYLPDLSSKNTFGQNLHLLQKLSKQPIEEIILFLAKAMI